MHVVDTDPTGRSAGQYARATVMRLRMRTLVTLGALAVATALLGRTFGLHDERFLASEIALLASMFVISRYVLPLLERRDRGATGEEQVGGLLDQMSDRGWRVIHDASLGRGNVDHILIGPPGVFTIETKSHPGPVRVARLHGGTLSQAQAQRRAIERVTGLEVEPLIVFSRAWVDRPMARRKGVRVVPARMLLGYLAKLPTKLSQEDMERARGLVVRALLEHNAGGGQPPGPRMPAVAQTLAWALAPTWLMDRLARTLGEAFTLTFAPSGLKLVMFSDPEAVKTIFTAPPDVAPSAAGTSPVAPVVGASSVLVLTGAEHMRQRKLLLPPFHGERMREYEDVIVEATRRDMAGWTLGQPMRLQQHTRSITLEVILRAVFGVEAERMGPLKQAITELFVPMGVLPVLRIALSRPSRERPTGALGRGLDRLDALIFQEIARRRSQSDLDSRSDILSLLLRARDEDGREMTDGELRDELVTLLLAGHETTATSVAWAVERLVCHPQKLERLVAEIDDGGEDYMTAVVNETLRVRPVVPIVARMLTQELQVGAYRLPAGTRVVPSIYLTNRNPRVYEHPREFRPERFLQATGGRAINPFSWIPFGGGIRRCIGASFALLEMKVMLRTMLGELEPRLPTGVSSVGISRGRSGERIARRAITLVPARGASVVWERRG